MALHHLLAAAVALQRHELGEERAVVEHRRRVDVAVLGDDERRGRLRGSRATSAASIAAVTNGMSASITTAATASGGTAAIPARTDAFFPRA